MKVIVALWFSWLFAAHGFLAPPLPRRSLAEPLQMGIFDSIMKAFDNAEVRRESTKLYFASKRHCAQIFLVFCSPGRNQSVGATHLGQIT